MGISQKWTAIRVEQKTCLELYLRVSQKTFAHEAVTSFLRRKLDAAKRV